jgi:beta-mannosidase
MNAVQVDAPDFSEQVTAQNRRQVVLVYELWREDERVSLGLVPFVPDKHLELTDPELRYTIGETEKDITLDVTARRLARFVWLEIEGTDAIFSDNYFDLPAGRTAKVTLPKIEGWTLDRARKALRLRSLVDSF